MGFREKVPPEGLGRLDEPEPFPVKRGLHPGLAHALHRLSHGETATGCTSDRRRGQDALDQGRHDEGPDRVVDQDPLALGRGGLEPEPHRLLPIGAARHHAGELRHRETPEERLRPLDPVAGHRQHDPGDGAGTSEYAQRVDQQGHPANGQVLLGHPGAHADTSSPRRHDSDGPRPALDGSHHWSDSAGGTGRAKIIRPAVVCSTLVTVTSTLWPMSFRPWSTTTMVPSSR